MKERNKCKDNKKVGGGRVNPKESCLCKRQLVLVFFSFGGGAERELEARMRPTTDKPPYRAQLAAGKFWEARAMISELTRQDNASFPAGARGTKHGLLCFGLPCELFFRSTSHFTHPLNFV